MAIVQEKQKPTEKKIPAKKETERPKTTEFVVKSRFVRMAPDKIRLVGKAIVGKKIPLAISVLDFSSKATAKPLNLILKHAIDRAKNLNLDAENLIIKNMRVDEGPKLKRRRIIHRGRANSILKRMSHITVVLEEQRKSEKRR